MCDVHAVADHEQVRADEADVVGIDGVRALARLFQQHGDRDPFGAALPHQVLGEAERAARFKNVVDKQHVAPGDIAFHVAHQPHLAARQRPGVVARQRQELDLGRHPRPVQRADQVGGENETALEDRYDQKVVIAGLGNLPGQRQVARRDCLGIVQDAQRPAPYFRHLVRWPSGFSAAR